MSTNSRIDWFLGHLNRVRSNGTDKWMCQCPAHEDRTPSLSVRLGEDGRILLNCFGACPPQAVVGALGLSLADLFPDSEPDPWAMREAQQRRERRERLDRTDGFCSDAVREARGLISSARGIDISNWSATQLDEALSELAAAHAILEAAGERYDDPSV
ncbi:hypothetical protein [Nitrospira sp. BLG_2]|uniref:hypothetical protein n=1 Tax=Nitrospira sp. BLG_2 TaxID=3397507 RepID=UPI003B9D319A